MESNLLIHYLVVKWNSEFIVILRQTLAVNILFIVVIDSGNAKRVKIVKSLITTITMRPWLLGMAVSCLSSKDHCSENSSRSNSWFVISTADHGSYKHSINCLGEIDTACPCVTQ